MNSKKIDFSLYLVTDRLLSLGRSSLEIIRAAIDGGVTCVQLREKNCSTREFIEEALTVKSFLADKKVPLIINDRVDIALAVSADGVHLGQKDMPIAMAKEILKPNMLVGISAETVQDAFDAEKGGADYVGVSPIFSTPTKDDISRPVGLEGLKAMRNVVNIPLVGIGGLNVTNAHRVIRHGADGIAVVSAIVSAEDPKDAAKKLSAVIMKARQS